MATTIHFVYKDVDYTLEFTRKSIQQMESQGFVAEEIDTKPMSTLPKLFAGAFIAHHRFTKQETINEIFDRMTDRVGLIEKLGEMYREPLMSLIDEPDEGAVGNIKWESNR